MRRRLQLASYKRSRPPFLWEEKELPIRASVGIALLGRHAVDAEAILRNADVAMYAAKSGGKGRSEVYEEEMHASMIDRMDLLADLQQAIERREMVVHYQPTVDLRW